MRSLTKFYWCSFVISGEDGRSRAEQLLHILRQIDLYVSSSVEYQRERGCRAAHEMLVKFRALCISGYCAFGCQGSCSHGKQIDRILQHNLPCKFAQTFLWSPSFNVCKRQLLENESFVSLPLMLSLLPSAAFVLPSRDALCLGERIMAYLPRSADSNPKVRKLSIQVGWWWIEVYRWCQLC